MHTNLEVVELSVADMEEMMTLERKVCIPPIQAQEDTIRRRLELGNIMLGVRMGGMLVGSIGFRYSTFSPDDLASFPKTFREFSTPTERPTHYNAGFCYSLNVDPHHRTLAVHPRLSKGLRPSGIGKALIASMAERMVKDSCSWLVGDGRPTFYNGSSDYPHERYEQDFNLKAILDDCAVQGCQPTDQEKQELINYSIFRAYNRALGGGFRVLWVLPDFFPGDNPTGGFRVILCKQLT